MSCTLGEVAVGAEVRIEIRVAVPADLAVETYANTANALSETDDPDASDNSSTVDGAVLPLPDLSVTKDDGVATIQAGDQVTYTITVTNSGNIGATGVVVTDPLPAGTTFVSCTVAAPATCGEDPAGSGTVVATIPLVPRDGGQAVIALTVQVAAGQPAGTDSITNTVTVSDDGLNGPERSTQNNSVSDTDALVFGPGPALAIAKDDGLDRVEGGDTATYTVTVTNAGDQDAADAVVTDTLPPGTTFVSCTVTPAASCAETAAGSGVVEATLPVVPNRQADPDAEVTLAITVTIDDPVAAGTTEFVNTAEVAHPDDQTSDDNTATDRDTYGADVAVAIDDGVDVVVPGQTVTYTVTLTNNGSSRVDTVTLTTDMSPELVDRSFAEAPATLAGEAAAPLPTGGFGRSFAAAALPPELVDATFAAATGSFDPTTGEWTDLALAPGEVAALSLTATVDPAARGQVTATVTAALPAGFTDPILGNNTNDDIDTLAPRAGVSLAEDGPAGSGGILPFTGANVLWLARAALALVAVGALLRAGTIRRRA